MGQERHTNSRLSTHWLDRAFDSLRHPYRRQILTALYDSTDVLQVEELSRRIDDHEQVSTQLYHKHLPKLEDLGYIEWDREQSVVQRGEEFDAVVPLIEFIQDRFAEERGR